MEDPCAMHDTSLADIMKRWRNFSRRLVCMAALCTSTRKTFYLLGYEAQPREFDPNNHFHWEPGPVFLNYAEAVQGHLRDPNTPVVAWKNIFTDGCNPHCPYCGRITEACPSCARWFCNAESGRPFPVLRHHSRPTQDRCPHCGTGLSDSAGSRSQHGKPVLMGRF